MSLFGKFENIFYIQKFRHCILGDSAPNNSPLLVRKKCQWIPLPGNRARTSYHHTVHNLVPMKQFYILYLTNSDAKKWLVKINVSFSSLQIHMANKFFPMFGYPTLCTLYPCVSMKNTSTRPLYSVPLCIYEYFYHSSPVLCELLTWHMKDIWQMDCSSPFSHSSHVKVQLGQPRRNFLHNIDNICAGHVLVGNNLQLLYVLVTNCPHVRVFW